MTGIVVLSVSFLGFLGVSCEGPPFCGQCQRPLPRLRLPRLAACVRYDGIAPRGHALNSHICFLYVMSCPRSETFRECCVRLRAQPNALSRNEWTCMLSRSAQSRQDVLPHIAREGKSHGALNLCTTRSCVSHDEGEGWESE